MPRPAVLPTVDWKTLIGRAASYEKWLASAEFTENASAMEAERKVLTLSQSDQARLAALRRTVHVVAFAEDWCGDVVRHVPVLQKLADFSPLVCVHYLSRADAPEVFVRFLTNGGEAVPKFIFLSEQYTECGNWGPMSSSCRAIIARGKAVGDVGRARQEVSKRYQADSQKLEVIEELLCALELAAAESV